MDTQYIPWILSSLFAVFMYFMNQTNEALKLRVSKLEDEVGKIKDNTVKKEDFREFKEELWLRFDKMEVAFDKRLKEIK